MANGLDRESRRFYRKDSANDLTNYWDGGEHYASKNRWVFECAWECANKGKFQVLISSLNLSIYYNPKLLRREIFCKISSTFSWWNLYRYQIQDIGVGE